MATYNGNNGSNGNTDNNGNNNVVANAVAANNSSSNNNNIAANNDVESGKNNNRTEEGNTTLTRASFKHYGELKFGLKKTNLKKSNPKLDLRLQGIKELVQGQSITEVHTLLLALVQANLLRMQYTAYKEQGLAKLDSDKDFIPISIHFSADLTFLKELGKDPRTVAEDEGWKNDLLDCQKKLIYRLKKQSKKERNLLWPGAPINSNQGNDQALR